MAGPELNKAFIEPTDAYPDKDVQMESIVARSIASQEEPIESILDRLPPDDEPVEQEELADQEDDAPLVSFDFLKPLGEATAGVGASLVRGVIDAGEGTINLVHDLSAGGASLLKKYGVTDTQIIDDRDEDRIDASTQILGAPRNSAEKFVQKLTSYLVPYAGLSKLVKGRSLLSGLKRVVGGGAIAGAIEDPNEERLSNFIQETDIPIASSIAEYLAHDPSDSKVEGRLKTAIEAAIFDLPFELSGPLFKSIKAKSFLKKAKNGTDQAAREAEEAAVEGFVEKSVPIKEGSKKTKTIKQKVKTETQDPETQRKLKEIDKIFGKGAAKVVSSLKKNKIDKTIEDIFGKQEVEALNKAIEDKKRGVITDEDLLLKAKELVEDSPRFQKVVDRLQEGGNALNAEELVAVRSHFIREHKKLLEISGSLPEDISKATEAELSLFQDQFEIVYNSHINIRAAAAETGRTLRSMQVAVPAASDKAKVEMIGNYTKLMGGKEDMAKFAKMFKVIQDVNKRVDSFDVVEQFAEASKWMQFRAATHSIFMENILSGLDTAIVNYMGGIGRLAEDTALSAGTEFFNLLRRDKNGVALGETAARIQGMYHGFFDGLKAVRQFYKEGKNFDGLVKIPERKSAFQSAGEFLNVQSDGGMGVALRYLGEVHATGNRLLTVGDLMNSSMAARGRLHALAHREALLSAGKKGTKEYNNFVNGVLKDPKKVYGLYAESLRAAKETNFTVGLNEGLFLGKTAEHLDNAIKSIPGLRVASLFMRFGVNAADYSIQRSFVPFLSPKFNAAMAAGGARRQEAIGKVILGNSLLGGVAYFASQGTVTGQGPLDFRVRQMQEQLGLPHHSVKIGDSWYKYDRAFPLGFFLGMGADLTEMISHLSEADDEAKINELIGASSAIAASYFTPQNFVDIAETLGTFKDITEGNTDSVSGPAARLLINATPFSGISKQLTKLHGERLKRDKRVEDPDFSGVQKVWERYKNEWLERHPLPGFSDKLPPLRNAITGEPVFVPNGWGPDILSPIATFEDKKDPVLEELNRLRMGGPFYNLQLPDGEEYLKIQRPPRTMSKKLTADKSVPVRLTSHQYDRYQQLNAGVGIKDEILEELLPEGAVLSSVKGKLRRGVYSIIEAEMKNGWQTVKDLTGNFDDEVTDTGKVWFIKKTMGLFRKAANQQMLQEFPELSEDINDGSANRLEALGFPEGAIKQAESEGQEAIESLNSAERSFEAIEDTLRLD